MNYFTDSCVHEMCDLSLCFYLQLAYDIDKEAEEQNSYLDGMVCFPVSNHVLTDF